MAIVLDGIKYQIVDPDIDGDGKTGGVEKVKKNIHVDEGTSIINQEPESVGVMKQFDEDTMNTEDMSSIDFNAYMEHAELESINGFETFASAGGIPRRWSVLTRKVKRNSRSLRGFGSNQKKETIIGQRDHEVSKTGGMGNAIRNLFKKQE